MYNNTSMYILVDKKTANRVRNENERLDCITLCVILVLPKGDKA